VARRRRLGLRRGLGPRAIASIAYGEIASSLYFALGVVALHALGFTPWVLLVVGVVFLLVALSYAEGTSAMPETGGAATFVRRAFNDPAGFVTGWVLFLDYLIVIALAALFAPHYFAEAVGWEGLTDKPWDIVVGIGVIAAVGLAWAGGQRRLIRRVARVATAIAFVVHVTLVVLGLIMLYSTAALERGTDLGVVPTWHAIAFALPLAMIAYTGLETVANLAAETREPGRSLPRGLFAGIGAVVILSFAIAVVGISAYPAVVDPRGPGGYASELGTDWLHAPLAGIAEAFGGHLPSGIVDALRIFIGLTGAVVLVAVVATSISGAGRLALSMGRHEMLPHAYGRLNPRSLIPPVSIASATLIASALLVLAASVGDEVRWLASLYSFGVLLAFVAAQVAVVRLRFREPNLERPFRVPVNVRIRGTPVPVAALVGIPATAAIWVAGIATHEAARIAGPIWLAVGIVVYVGVRRARGERLFARVEEAEPDLVPTPEGAYERILVPVKLGPIGEEVLATAIRLAEEQRSEIHVLHVIRVPFELPLDAELLDREERASASLIDAKLLAAEHSVRLVDHVVRARSIGEAIAETATEIGADLILMGSSPRWRRQSRFFSPTVDYVLRKAPCEVMVIAYPQGVLEEETSATLSS
jgi:APA family basic amino acid/polyamine antiporter